MRAAAQDAAERQLWRLCRRKSAVRSGPYPRSPDGERDLDDWPVFFGSGAHAGPGARSQQHGRRGARAPGLFGSGRRPHVSGRCLAGSRPVPARRHGGGSGEASCCGRRGHTDLRARRLRRRRDLRDRARGLPAAGARRRPGLASAVTLRGGLRPERPDACPAGRGRRRARPDGGLRHHRCRRGGGSEGARSRRDRDRSSPAGRDVPGLPGRRDRSRATTRSRVSAAPPSSGSSPRRCSAATIRSSTATSMSSRSRPLPTSCRSSTRAARLRLPACGGLRRRRSPGCER